MLWVADPTAADIFNPLLQYGLPGIMLALFVFGWLIPKGVYEAKREECENWRKAFETEQAAHQLTREASVESNRRAEAAVEAARTAAATLGALQHLTGSERA